MTLELLFFLLASQFCEHVVFGSIGPTQQVLDDMDCYYTSVRYVNIEPDCRDLWASAEFARSLMQRIKYSRFFYWVDYRHCPSQHRHNGGLTMIGQRTTYLSFDALSTVSDRGLSVINHEISHQDGRDHWR